MPSYEIVIESGTLGVIRRRRFANLPEEALTEFLDEMEPTGVKRLGPTEARFLDELTITVRPVAEVVPLYASAGAMATPGREMWRR